MLPIIPEVAEFKAKGSPLKGQASISISRLGCWKHRIQTSSKTSKSRSIWTLCQGIAKPVNDLSRGCSSEDVAGVVAITAVQAQQK